MNTVFKYLGFLFLIISITACSQKLEGDTFERSLESGAANLKIVYVPAPGFAYLDENGELTGVSIDIMEEFAEFVHYSQGVQINYEFIPETSFSDFYSTVKNARGGVFGLGNVTITEQRRLEIGFSPPYMTNIAVLISHEDVPTLRELNTISNDFAGLTALAIEGTLHETRIKNLRDMYWQDMEISYANSNSEILRHVAEYGNYFAYIDIYNYWRALESGEPLKQHPMADLASERFGIIMPLNSDWDAIVTSFFDQGQGFRTSRTYRSILEKHLGEELTEKLERARKESEQF